MQIKYVREEAERLVRDHGADAYDKAREAMQEARRRKNVRLERYFSKVSRAVARHAGREVGVDTASGFPTP